MVLGLAVLAPLGAHHASAWEGSCFDYASPDRPWTELVVDVGGADVASLAASGLTVSDGTVSITVSNPQPADVALPVGPGNIGSLDFTASPGVDAVYVRASGFDDQFYRYHPPAPATSGTGLRSTSGTTSIDWLSFCYAESQPAETTTTTTTTTAAPPVSPPTSVAVAPEVTTAPTAPPTTAPSVAVLPQVETAPELAFTGRDSRGPVAVGLAFVASGLAMIVFSRRTARRSTGS
jgi:hypothetical protein